MSLDDSESSESSLEDGSDESSFLRLRRFFFFLLFFFFGAESDDDNESNESDGDGSGSEFTFGPCFLQFDVELCSDQLIFNRVSISLLFSRSSIFSRSNTLLVSKSNSLINLRYANFSLIVSISP